jgi:hypothetical protein
LKNLDLQFVKDTLSELDPSLDGSEQSESYMTALVLVSALVQGPNVRRLAVFTGVPEQFVERIRERMVRAELWDEIDVFSDHWFGEGNMVSMTALWLDILIAQGLVIREWDEEAGEYRYCHAAYAQVSNKPQHCVN